MREKEQGVTTPIGKMIIVLNVILAMAIVAVFLIAAVGSASAYCVCNDGWCDNVNRAYYQCGDTVTESCTFNGTMNCPATGNGLVVGADNIVIDGAGHLLNGSVEGATCPGSESNPVVTHSGIVNARYDNVVVKDIEIQNFCTGIVMGTENSTWNPGGEVVENMTVTGCKIHDCGRMDSDATHGIHLVGAIYSNITKNTIYNISGFQEGGCWEGGNGIFMYGSNVLGDWEHGTGDHNTITCNKIYDTEKSGIFSKMGCMHNKMSYNYITRNVEVGLYPCCCQSNYNTYEYNNLSNNSGSGFHTSGENNILRYNTAHNNGARGIYSNYNVEMSNNSACGQAYDIDGSPCSDNTCNNSYESCCDYWNCNNLVPVYFDFDGDGHYSTTPENCQCNNILGVGACCNPGLFNASHAAMLNASGICWLTPGDDTDDCDPGIPGTQKTWHVYPGDSIQAAINNASDGDTIYVHEGTYYEYRINVNKSLSLIGDGMNKTIVDGRGGTDYLMLVSADWVNVSGFTLQNLEDCGSGVMIVEGNHCNISYNDIHQGQAFTFSMSSGTHDNILKGNTIYYASCGCQGMLTIRGTNHTVTDNTIGQQGGAIQVYCSGSLIYNNDFGTGISVPRVDNTWNTTYDCTSGPNIIGGPCMGGNHFANYAGADNFSGPNQDQPGSDGIGDTPYGSDYLPLVEFTAAPDLTITEKVEEWIVEGSTYNISYTVKNIGDAAAGASDVGIYIDGIFNRTVPTKALAMNEAESKTVGPFTLTGENDTIEIRADNNSIVSESNETNNSMENVFERSTGGASVYLIGRGDSTDVKVKNALEEWGHTVTMGPKSSDYIGSDLTSYDTVVLLHGGDMPDAGQNCIKDFVESQGGGLVAGASVIGCACDCPGGDFCILEPILPAKSYDGWPCWSSETYTVDTPDPILNAGLPDSFSFNTGSSICSHIKKDNATRFYRGYGWWEDDAVIGWECGSGRVIGNDICSLSTALDDTNFKKLFGNCVQWAKGEAKPDLVIAEKTEEWVVEGATYNITYTVKNIGDAAAGASDAGIYIDGIFNRTVPT
ncbi:hypothetical protein CW714_09045, partial [Methanophagales archaeon]